MVPGLSKERTLPTTGPDPHAREPPARVHRGWKSPRTEQADGGLEVDTEERCARGCHCSLLGPPSLVVVMVGSHSGIEGEHVGLQFPPSQCL